MPDLIEQTWISHDPELSRNARRRSTGTYIVTRPKPIAGLTIDVPAALVQETDEALIALRDFETYADTVLGTAPAPLASILLRTESSSSSQIENLTVGAKQLALAELGESRSPNAALVSGNVRAMERALALADDLCTENILAMHRALLTADPHMSNLAGHFRKELVWVGSSNSYSPVGAQHVAPEYETVPALIDDTVRFLQRDDLPVIAQVAIGHAQFETIHPFADGNGRTGRALIQSLLRSKKVTRSVTVPLSSGLLSNREQYFDALAQFRRGDAGPIVATFAQSAVSAARNGRHLVEELATIQTDDTALLQRYRSDALVHRLPHALIGQPVINSAYVSRTLGVNMASAIRVIGQAERAGLITETTGASRNRVWQHPRILSALDDFAEQIRR